MSAPARPSEFVVKVPKSNADKKFSILKFNGNLNVDPTKWPTMKLKMTRQSNRAEVEASEIKQTFGEGSEYGKAAREEARRKKYGRQLRKYNLDDQPWQMTLADEEGKERKFRSIRESGAGEHADYWVFLKSGDDFHAHKIADWYQFLPCITHKTLDIDQAEEQFQQRNKVMNQFALKAQIQQQLKDQGEEGELTVKSSSLKIKDEMSSDEEDDKDDDEGNTSTKKKGKKSKKDADRQKKKEKKQRVESADQVAAYESDDGDDEGREFDYMSDSGSDSEREEKTVEQKVEESLVSVADEAGLKQSIGSDLEDEDEEEEEDEKTKDLADKIRAQTEGREDDVAEKFKNIEERDSSDSDSDDPDSGNMKSILFMEKKEAKKRPAEEATSSEQDAKRAKVTEEKCDMPAAPLAAHAAAEAFDEDTVRRLLQRKPHTTKELLNKVKTRGGQMNKQEIVSKLAQILKRIEPRQYRQTVGQKDVLYFTLQPG